MNAGLRISFFGSSLLSAYWNGAATYYRGIIKALYDHGHQVTFYEPAAFNRQEHRDLEEPEWARVHVYTAEGTDGVYQSLEEARKNSDWIIKASGVGVFDELLEREVASLRTTNNLIAFWDVDAPATLERLAGNPNDPFRSVIPKYDVVFTYGGGSPVIHGYQSYGSQECIPIYNALDPSTHHPVNPNPKFDADISFLGNRLPDREARVDEFFFGAARIAPEHRFLIGGNGWQDKAMPENVTYAGHVYTTDHNAFNCSPRAVLNISRDSMARYGFSPATRVFEAAGAGACLITDEWEGIEQFFEPGQEILVARNGEEVEAHLSRLSPDKAQEIGQNALRRALFEHTYAHRAAEVDAVLQGQPVPGR